MEARAWTHMHVYLLGRFASDANTYAGVMAIYMHVDEFRPKCATLGLNAIRYRK